MRGRVIEGLESVAMEATRNLNYANKAHDHMEKVVEGMDQPSATCLTKTENKSVDDA